MMMKKLLPALALVLGVSALPTNIAHAHDGGTARHGGVVATASDLTFELVAQGGHAVVYVADNGKPLAPVGLKGKLTVLTGAVKSEADLVVAGDKLEARSIALAKGAKVVAAITMPSAKVITVRFTVQ